MIGREDVVIIDFELDIFSETENILHISSSVKSRGITLPEVGDTMDETLEFLSHADWLYKEMKSSIFSQSPNDSNYSRTLVFTRPRTDI